ncbi:hypothetical protein D3C87_1655500 [compost metagenome]
MLTHLTHQRPGFRVTAAEEHDIRFLRADFRDQRVEVFLTARQAFVHHVINATFCQRGFRRIRQSLTVGVFIVNDHHPFGLQLINNKIAGDFPLLIVTSAHAEHIAHAAFGD